MLLNFFIISLFCFSAYSTEVTVNDGMKVFVLKYDKSSIDFKGSMLNLTLTQKPCQSKLTQRFEETTTGMLSRATKQTTPSGDDLHVVKDGKSFHLKRKSPTGKYILQIPEEIKRLKIEESLLCK